MADSGLAPLVFVLLFIVYCYMAHKKHSDSALPEKEKLLEAEIYLSIHTGAADKKSVGDISEFDNFVTQSSL